MKKLIPIALILLLASCKKEDMDVYETRSFSIQSTSTGANYPVTIALPDNYNPATETYATIYVLDGEYNFDYVTRNCRELSGNGSSSNVLVVSIGYGNDRSFDYTPSVAQGGGGAEGFMHFIADELIPRMESDYAADTMRANRVILGHSYGGLLAAYAFTNYNEVFGTYLMLSPSLWYDNEILLRLEQENRDLNKNRDQRVFMGLGGLESSGRMMAPFEAFYQRLQNNYADMKLMKHFEPRLDHNGSRNPNILAGLQFYYQNR